MANISDIIEQFILKTMGEEMQMDISRNELASFFRCAPSQINYVLETRFTIDRGFIKESHRGGGGYIRLTKINVDEDNYVNNLILESVGDDLSMKRLSQITEKLVSEEIITDKERALILAGLSDESLAMPLTIRDNIRARSFKNILTTLLKENR